jgi:hypothetical protein
MASLAERKLEFCLVVHTSVGALVTDRGLVRARSRAGLGLGGEDPAKVGQSSSGRRRSSSRHFYKRKTAN